MFRKIPNYGQGQSSTKKVWKRNLKIKKKSLGIFIMYSVNVSKKSSDKNN